MRRKTIALTEEAYEVLKSMKLPGENFSKTILRIVKIYLTGRKSA